MNYIPIFLNKREYNKFIKSLKQEFPTFQEWSNFIQKHRNTFQYKAKDYIYKNWKRVSNWDTYLIEINDIIYTNERMDTSKSHSDIFTKMCEKYNDKCVNIDWIDVVLDTSDGDLSVAVNNKNNWKFLDEDEIVELAIYIENQLK